VGLVVALAGLGAVVVHLSEDGSCQRPPFTEVAAFTRSISFVAGLCDNQLLIRDLHTIRAASPVNMNDFLDQPIRAVAVPDGWSPRHTGAGSLYVLTDSSAYACDGNGRPYRTIPIDGLGYEKTRASFIGAAVHDDRVDLWIRPVGLTSGWVVTQKTQDCGGFQVTPYDGTQQPDVNGEMLLQGSDFWGTFLVDARELVGHGRPVCGPSMLAGSRTVIVSSSTATHGSDVYRLEYPNMARRRLTSGSMARWGCDGNIYFTRGGMQLWRWNSTKKRAEQLFSAGRTGGHRWNRSRIAVSAGPARLVFSADRSVLAFYYAVPGEASGLDSTAVVYRCGMFIVDLTAHECMHIPPEEFCAVYWQSQVSKPPAHNAEVTRKLKAGHYNSDIVELFCLSVGN